MSRGFRRALLGAALLVPLLFASPGGANHLICVEASATPTECGSGILGIAVCGPTGGSVGPDTNIDLSGLPNSGIIHVNALGTAGVDAEGVNILSAGPSGHAIVWTATGVHAGVGSTTGGNVDCPE